MNINEILSINPDEATIINGTPIWESMCTNCAISNCENCAINSMLIKYSGLFNNCDIDKIMQLLKMSESASNRIDANKMRTSIENVEPAEIYLLEYVGNADNDSTDADNNNGDDTDDDTDIVNIWKNGGTLATVAKQLNCNVTTARTHLIRIMGKDEYMKYGGKEYHHMTDDLESVIIDEYKSGMTIDAIRKRHHIAYRRVSAVVKSIKPKNTEPDNTQTLNSLGIDEWKETVTRMARRHNIKFSEVFIRMRNIYGIVLDQLKKEYNRHSAEPIFYKSVPSLDAIHYNSEARSIFDVCLLAKIDEKNA